MFSDKLYFLHLPGIKNSFSGYGLAIGQPSPLVGLLMIDKPNLVDPEWLQDLTNHFGSYDITLMTKAGERGLLATMYIEPDSLQYLRQFPGDLADSIADRLQALTPNPPNPKLNMSYNHTLGLWVSEFRLSHAD